MVHKPETMHWNTSTLKFSVPLVNPKQLPERNSKS